MARSLVGYLLLMYLIWFPLHIQNHDPHSVFNNAQEENKDTVPGEDICLTCDWSTHQSTVEAFVPSTVILNCIAFPYQISVSGLPYIEVHVLVSPRAPPALA